MIDRIFAPVLTFLVLLVGTVGLMAALLTKPVLDTSLAQGMPASSPVIMLEPVLIVGKRDETAAATAPARDMQRASASQAAEGRGVMLSPVRD